MSRKWSQRTEDRVNTLSHSSLLQSSFLPSASSTFKHNHSQLTNLIVIKIHYALPKHYQVWFVEAFYRHKALQVHMWCIQFHSICNRCSRVKSQFICHFSVCSALLCDGLYTMAKRAQHTATLEKTWKLTKQTSSSIWQNMRCKHTMYIMNSESWIICESWITCRTGMDYQSHTAK